MPLGKAKNQAASSFHSFIWLSVSSFKEGFCWSLAATLIILATRQPQIAYFLQRGLWWKICISKVNQRSIKWKKNWFCAGGFFPVFLIARRCKFRAKENFVQISGPIFYQMMFQELLELFLAVILGASLILSWCLSSTITSSGFSGKKRSRRCLSSWKTMQENITKFDFFWSVC